MINYSVNLVGVAVAAVLAMAVGFIWYGPLFGKEWMKLMGKSKEQFEKEKAGSNMGMMYGIAFIGALVTAFVLSVFISSLEATSLAGGAMVALWAWVGFILTVTGMNALFMKTPKKLFYIDVFHHLAAFLVMGAVIGMIG